MIPQTTILHVYPIRGRSHDEETREINRVSQNNTFPAVVAPKFRYVRMFDDMIQIMEVVVANVVICPRLHSAKFPFKETAAFAEGLFRCKRSLCLQSFKLKLIRLNFVGCGFLSGLGLFMIGPLSQAEDLENRLFQFFDSSSLRICIGNRKGMWTMLGSCTSKESVWANEVFRQAFAFSRQGPRSRG